MKCDVSLTRFAGHKSYFLLLKVCVESDSVHYWCHYITGRLLAVKTKLCCSNMSFYLLCLCSLFIFRHLSSCVMREISKKGTPCFNIHLLFFLNWGAWFPVFLMRSGKSLPVDSLNFLCFIYAVAFCLVHSWLYLVVSEDVAAQVLLRPSCGPLPDRQGYDKKT